MPEFSDGIEDGEVGDLDENFRLHVVERVVVLARDVVRDFVEVGEDNERFVRDPHGERVVERIKIEVLYLEALVVVLAHLGNPSVVDLHSLFISKRKQELLESLLNEPRRSGFLDPRVKVAPALVDVKVPLVFALQLVFFAALSLAENE